MLRIRKPRNFSFVQFAVILTVGVFGGLYIYQPILLQHIKGDKKQVKAETTEK